MPRIGRHHRGDQLDVGHLLPRDGEQREGVVAEDLRRAHRLDAGRRHLADLLGEVGHRPACVDRHSIAHAGDVTDGV